MVTNFIFCHVMLIFGDEIVFLARFRCQIWLIWYKDSYAEKKKKALLLPLEIEVALHIYLNLNPCKNFIFYRIYLGLSVY